MVQPSRGLVARGSISIGLDQLQKQRTVAVKTAQDIGKGFQSAFQGAAKSESAFTNQLVKNAQRQSKAFESLSRAAERTRQMAGVAPNSYLEGLKRQAQALEDVQKETRKIEPVARKSFTASASAVNTFNQRLDSTVARLKTIERELTVVTAAGSALTVFGLRAADNVRNLQIRFTELAGSQQQGLALMEEIGDAAQGVNLPIRATQSAFAGLIPAIRDAGGEVETYVNLIARLSTLNPNEGIEGAVFAVREALSSGGTDLVSLAERFNLPRAQLRELIAETGDFASALDIILTRQGATNAALEGFSGSLSTATTRLRDAATRALERAFLPQLDAAVGLLNLATDVINSLPDGLIEFAGGAITATTAASGFALALIQIQQIGQKLQQSGIFGSNGLGTRGIVGAGALAVGSNLGVSIARGIGAATGDERVQNASLDTALETGQNLLRQLSTILTLMVQKALPTLQQVIFLIVNALLEAGRNLARVFATIITSVATFPLLFDRFKGQFEVATGNLLLTIGNLIQSLSDIVPGLDLSAQSQGLIAQGNARVTEGESRIAVANAAIEATQQTALDAVDSMFDEFQSQALEFAGVVTNESNKTRTYVNSTLSPIGRQAESVFDEMRLDVEFVAQIIQGKLREISNAVRFQTELNRLQRDGTVEQVNDRIAGLEDERAAIQTLLPEVEALAENNKDAAASLREYQQRIEEIDGQIRQLTQLTPELARQAISELGQSFADEVKAIEKTRSEAIEKLDNTLQSDLAELDQDLAKQFRDGKKEELEALQTFQDEQADIEKEHNKRLLEIERTGREDIIDAAGRLDAAGVRAAIKAREQQREDEADRYSEEQERNQERLEDTKESLAEERKTILDNYQARRNELILAAQAERRILQQKYQAEISTAQQAYNTELQLYNQYANQRIKNQSNAINAELANQSAGYNAMVKGASVFASQLARIGSNLGTPVKTVSTAQTSFSSNMGAASSSSSSSGLKLLSSSVSKQIARFADGGMPIFGGSGEALAYVKNKEAILTQRQTPTFERFVSAMETFMNGSSAQVQSVDNIPIDITGVSSFEDLVERVARGVLAKVYMAQKAN